MIHTTLLSLLLFGAAANLARADKVDTTGPTCVRGLTYDGLMKDDAFMTPQDKSDLAAGRKVTKIVSTKSMKGYKMAYLFALSSYDADLVMGVFSACDRHAGSQGLGGFIEKSKYVDANGKDLATSVNKSPFRVYYRQKGNLLYSGASYKVENTLLKLASGGYRMDTRLLESSDASFSPKWLDAYFQVTPQGSKGSLVVACNLMIPRSDSFQGTFNEKAAERFKASGRNLEKWIERVSDGKENTVDNPNAAQAYRDRLRMLLGADK